MVCYIDRARSLFSILCFHFTIHSDDTTSTLISLNFHFYYISHYRHHAFILFLSFHVFVVHSIFLPMVSDVSPLSVFFGDTFGTISLVISIFPATSRWPVVLIPLILLVTMIGRCCFLVFLSFTMVLRRSLFCRLDPALTFLPLRCGFWVFVSAVSCLDVQPVWPHYYTSLSFLAVDYSR